MGWRGGGGGGGGGLNAEFLTTLCALYSFIKAL